MKKVLFKIFPLLLLVLALTYCSDNSTIPDDVRLYEYENNTALFPYKILFDKKDDVLLFKIKSYKLALTGKLKIYAFTATVANEYIAGKEAGEYGFAVNPFILFSYKINNKHSKHFIFIGYMDNIKVFQITVLLE